MITHVVCCCLNDGYEFKWFILADQKLWGMSKSVMALAFKTCVIRAGYPDDIISMHSGRSGMKTDEY